MRLKTQFFKNLKTIQRILKLYTNVTKGIMVVAFHFSSGDFFFVLPICSLLDINFPFHFFFPSTSFSLNVPLPFSPSFSLSLELIIMIYSVERGLRCYSFFITMENTPATSTTSSRLLHFHLSLGKSELLRRCQKLKV